MNKQNNHLSIEPSRPAGLPPLPKIRQIALLVDDENYSQVDLYAQHILRVLPNDPYANLACAWVASRLKLHVQGKRFLQRVKGNQAQHDRSVELMCADMHININELKSLVQSVNTADYKNNSYHLAKAWGFGFGSEMSALMGQAYLAEVCNRELIVHWGSNFLYRPSAGDDCVFDCYFERFNELTINSVSENLDDVFPPKWNKNNIHQENINKRKGEYSKLSALYFLNKNEEITVADYYTGVIHIKPWVEKEFSLNKMTVDETYRYLAKKYLRPKKTIVEQVNEFVETNLSQPFVAVHARGSDKDEGYRALTSIPGQILQCAKQRLEQMPRDTKLFLMTDDNALLEVYQKEFGDRLIQTDCQRCDTQVGVHYDQQTDKLQAGKEMLIDMLVAARADCFIGLGLSNPSQLITYFGDFNADNYILFGENRLKQFNTHLYKTIPVR